MATAFILVLIFIIILGCFKENNERSIGRQVSQEGAIVIRNQELIQIPISSLLVGDIMIIQEGQILPVDGVVLLSNQLVCNESLITGGLYPIKKKCPIDSQDVNASPFLISGSVVVEGQGQMIVLAVGKQTTKNLQKIFMNKKNDEFSQNRRQSKLDKFGKQLESIGVSLAYITFFVMTFTLIYFILSSNDPNVKLFSQKNFVEVLINYRLVINILIIAIPQGLPLVYTLSQAYAVTKLLRDGHLVRNLKSCENLANVDTICFDKTENLRDISELVNNSTQAGIILIMVTADSLDSTISICKEVGILKQDYNLKENDYTVMEGNQFREKVGGLKEEIGKNRQVIKYSVGDLKTFREISKQLRVLANCTPEDKLLLLIGLQQCGSVVALTGKNTHETYALQNADVGFALGISGDEDARSAADILLLQDSLSSIIQAVIRGRNIFDSLRNFICFQLIFFFAALFIVFLGCVVVRESPLNIIQILWITLILAIMGAGVFSTEQPSYDLLKRSPVKQTEVFVSSSMWKFIILQNIYQVGVLLVVLFDGDILFGVENGIKNSKWTEQNGVHLTLFFNVFGFLTIFNLFNCRKIQTSEVNILKGCFNNQVLIYVITIAMVIQLLLIEFGGKYTQCSPLSSYQNLICIAIGFSSVIVSMMIKLLPRWIDELLCYTNPFKESSKSQIVVSSENDKKTQ